MHGEFTYLNGLFALLLRPPPLGARAVALPGGSKKVAAVDQAVTTMYNRPGLQRQKCDLLTLV